jgi:hypothetical protein
VLAVSSINKKPRVVIYRLTKCKLGDIYVEVIECYSCWEAEIIIHRLNGANFGYNCYVIMQVLV